MRIHAEVADRVTPTRDRPTAHAAWGAANRVLRPGTPAKDPDQFTIYAAIRDELVERGMPDRRSASSMRPASRPR